MNIFLPKAVQELDLHFIGQIFTCKEYQDGDFELEHLQFIARDIAFHVKAGLS